MKNFENFRDEICDQVEIFVEENTHRVDEAADLRKMGLDPRVGAIFVTLCKTAIGVRQANNKLLSYYGGFEYVDADLVFNYGDYVFYMIDFDNNRGCRVYEHISKYYSDENESENESEDDQY